MVLKIYISGLSGNKEVKKRQQRVLMILDSKNLQYTLIDITEPGQEKLKDFMQENSKSFGVTTCDTNPRHPLPPQIFNDDIYCGDYNEFDLANENDTIEEFLKIAKSEELLKDEAGDKQVDHEDPENAKSFENSENLEKTKESEDGNESESGDHSKELEEDNFANNNLQTEIVA